MVAEPLGELRAESRDFGDFLVIFGDFFGIGEGKLIEVPRDLGDFFGIGEGFGSWWRSEGRVFRKRQNSMETKPSKVAG